MNARTIAITAVMIAITTAITASPLRIPSGIGYGNLSDVVIFFAAFAFGPMVGFAAGAVGAGLADVLGGYAYFAPLTFVVHGLEGLIAGYIGARTNSLACMFIAWIAGSVILVGGYFIGEALVPAWGGLPQAFVDLPTNLTQAVLGLVGISLALLVRKAYPPIAQMVTGPTWVEEK
jgi:energy-coupling factor transport system substrate-specific component